MDPTVAACEVILNTIRSSGLNWSIQESPFSLSISIKKSFLKVKEEPIQKQKVCPVPMQNFGNDFTMKNLMNMPSNLVKNPIEFPMSPLSLSTKPNQEPSVTPDSNSQGYQPPPDSTSIQEIDSSPSSQSKPSLKFSELSPLSSSLPINKKTMPSLMQSFPSQVESKPQMNPSSFKTNFEKHFIASPNQHKNYLSHLSSKDMTPFPRQHKNNFSHPSGKLNPSINSRDMNSFPSQPKNSLSHPPDMLNTSINSRDIILFPSHHKSNLSHPQDNFNHSIKNNLSNPCGKLNNREINFYPSQQLEETMDSIEKLRERHRKISVKLKKYREK